jgi:ATP-dependent Lon protease
VIIPYANAPELSEIPAYITNKLVVRPVRTMEEVLEIALARPLSAPKKEPRPAGKADRPRDRRKVSSRPGMA